MSVQELPIRRRTLQLELVPHRKQNSTLRYVLWAAAAVYVLISLYLLYETRTEMLHIRTKILVLQEKQWLLDAEQVELGRRLLATSPAPKQELSSEFSFAQQQMARGSGQPDRRPRANPAK